MTNDGRELLIAGIADHESSSSSSASAETMAFLLATKQVKTIKQRWTAVCDEAKLSKIDRNFLWRRQFLNPYAFLEAPEALTKLID